MKRFLLGFAAVSAAFGAYPQSVPAASAWNDAAEVPEFNRHVVFETDAIGIKLPILWGFDTAWNDYANMLRGVRHSGKDAVSCARVSFQPWAEITEKGVLPDMLQKNLDARMATVGLIGKMVDIVLNLDGGENTLKEIYGGYEYENPDDPWWSPKTYIGDVTVQGPKWADLIDATAAAVEAKGYRVITASPLNEPDLELNGTPIDLFYQIAKSLKDIDAYPRFKDIRISGGNTLNNDEADRWYEYCKEFLDEGNTHQLAGSFDTYADFFAKVRNDGKHATADELHNVMEAMVGVQYGMQTGIWWGTAERARGEFMKASFGERLAYAENRGAWSAASIYRNPMGRLQAFVGCSERQAKPSSYNFVAADRPVFINGAGPLRECVINIPGDPDGAYQTELQRNAEAVFEIDCGDDIRPYVDGDYYIINTAYGMALGVEDGSLTDGKSIALDYYTGRKDQIWNVSAVPENWGGDFSYSFIRNIDGETVKSLDDNNWNLEEGGKVICYGFSGAGVQQWALEYAGDGNFRVRNKFSGLYLSVNPEDSSAKVVQREYSDNCAQLWRFVSKDAVYETDAPDMPEGLTASPNSASVQLEWNSSADAQSVSYTVARADGDDGEFTVVARGVTSTSWLDNGLSGVDSYRYKVMAEDAAGNRSAFSPQTDVDMTDVPGSLIAHCAFNDSPVDDTENRFDIRPIGKVSYRKAMNENVGSIVFSTGGYAQLPYSLLSSEEFAVAFWYRSVTEQEGKCLFSTGIGEDKTLALYPCSNGAIELVATAGDMVGSVSAPSPEVKVWHHVAISVGDDDVTLYVDGRPCEQGDGVALRQLIPEVRLLTYLGADNCRNNTIAASVADMRVYNKSIDAADVAAIMSEVSGVEEIAPSAGEVISTEYYAPSGLRLAVPAENGVTIIRSRYTDGSVRIRKVMRSPHVND